MTSEAIYFEAALAASEAAIAAAEAALATAEAAMSAAGVAGITGATTTGAGAGAGFGSSFLLQAARAKDATSVANRSDDFIIFLRSKVEDMYRQL